MCGDQLDILVLVYAVLPGQGSLQVVTRAGERQAKEAIFRFRVQFGTMFLQQGLYFPSPVQPLLHIGCLVPVGRSHWTLGRRREQIWLIAVLPQVQLVVTQGFASQGHSVDKCLPSCRVVAP